MSYFLKQAYETFCACAVTTYKHSLLQARAYCTVYGHTFATGTLQRKVDDAVFGCPCLVRLLPHIEGRFVHINQRLVTVDELLQLDRILLLRLLSHFKSAVHHVPSVPVRHPVFDVKPS